VRVKNFDILSVNFRGNINWIPSSENPGVITFLYALTRATLLSYFVIVLLYFAVYKEVSSYSFSKIEVAQFILIFAFFEEQGRWIYSSNASSKVVSGVKFAICIIFFESFFFFISSKIEVVDFLLVRLGSMCVHGFNAFLCIKSTGRELPFKYLCFSFAVAFHVIMNFDGSVRLFGWLG